MGKTSKMKEREREGGRDGVREDDSELKKVFEIFCKIDSVVKPIINI